MENHPRKGGFSFPAGQKSIKPTSITDASVRLTRVETSTSQPTTVAPEDLEHRGENYGAEGEELVPWRPRMTTSAKPHHQDKGISDGGPVGQEIVVMIPRRQKNNWNAGAIAVAAMGALGSLAAALYAIRPRDPIFVVELITLDGFNLRFCTDSPLLLAVVDVSLTLHINVTNPNVAPIVFSSTIMDIYYRSSLLGQAKVHSGDQAAKSSQTMEVPAKLDGLELTNHMKDLFYDVAKREMMLHSVVTISGESLVWKWRHPFEVHVDSDIKVDPIMLDVLEQENRAHLEMGALCS